MGDSARVSHARPNALSQDSQFWAAKDLEFTGNHLHFHGQVRDKVVAGTILFDEAYAKTGWSSYANMPTFEPANWINAYGPYRLMECESLDGDASCRRPI